MLTLTVGEALLSSFCKAMNPTKVLRVHVCAKISDDVGYHVTIRDSSAEPTRHTLAAVAVWQSGSAAGLCRTCIRSAEIGTLCKLYVR